MNIANKKFNKSTKSRYIKKLKNIEKKLKDKEISLTNQINSLKQTTEEQTEKIKKYIAYQALQNETISELLHKTIRKFSYY